jgi:hypothetical protein
MKTRYRIIRDNYCGYEVQVWRWYFPFWIADGLFNSHSSIERARQFIDKKGKEVVEYYPPKKK